MASTSISFTIKGKEECGSKKRILLEVLRSRENMSPDKRRPGSEGA
jgi:hypothetical protein